MTTNRTGFRAPVVVVPMGVVLLAVGVYLLVTSSGTQSVVGGLGVGVGIACVVAGVVRYRRSGRLGEPS